MRSVRISFKAAETIAREVFPSKQSRELVRALEQLGCAVERVRGQARAANERKSARIAERRQEVGEVRAAVMARAQGQCEACPNLDRRAGEAKRHALHMDHFFDRGHETVETCWALCDDCHKRKHRMIPSLAAWFFAFAGHAARHGYLAEAEEALKSAASFRDRNALPFSPAKPTEGGTP